VLEWQVAHLPDDRVDMQMVLSHLDSHGNVVTQEKHSFGVQPMEWAAGDVIVEWFDTELPAAATQFSVQMTRGTDVWKSASINSSMEPQ
jgi:hypothetical protein